MRRTLFPESNYIWKLDKNICPDFDVLKILYISINYSDCINILWEPKLVGQDKKFTSVDQDK